jgi:hypothetical protein
MAKDYSTEVTLAAIEQPNPSMKNPAVARCCKVWRKVYRAAIDAGRFSAWASDDAGEAYRAALPLLVTRESCRDFIACVAFGVLIKAVPEKQSGKLIYAAQTVLSTLPDDAKL